MLLRKLRKLCCTLCKTFRWTLIADDIHTAGYRSNLHFTDILMYWFIFFNYFGGALSRGLAPAQERIKVDFLGKIGHAKSVGFRFYSVIWRSESRITSKYLEITSISLIYSLTYSRKKEFLFWLVRGLSWLTCATLQIRGDSKLRD